MKLLVLSAIMAAFVLAGCTVFDRGAVTSSGDNPTVEDACIQLCQHEVNSGTDLSAGPCLGNPMEINSSWVCDVAHYPRQDVDDNPTNQCSEYGQQASHFVEIDENCELINTL
ncbi:MAG: hypothetical protein V1911_03145 [Candidatus Micrarchaeota archaeon]